MGISYFLQDGANLKQNLKEIWEGEIEPYLNEYFYDRREAAAALSFATLSKTTLSDWT
jgi:hypothetical protein